MKFGQKLFLMILASALVAVAAGTLGIDQVDRSQEARAQALAKASGAQLQIARVMTLFKIQVQEWKDTLLRGSDPALLEKHWRAFQTRESEVDAEIAALSQGLPSGEAAELVGKFREAHGVMGRRYREAYEKFTAAGFASSVGDAAVRGVDRVPTETLRQAITALDKLKEQADLQGELGVRQAKWLAGGLMLAGLIGAGLVSLGVSKKAVSPVGS